MRNFISWITPGGRLWILAAAALGLAQLQLWSFSIPLLWVLTVLYLLTFFRHQSSRGTTLSYFIGLMMLSIFIYADFYRFYGIVDSSTATITHDFKTALYFSMVSWTTLGYGDFRPSQDIRIHAASEALLGYFYMGILVAQVLSFLSERYGQKNL